MTRNGLLIGFLPLILGACASATPARPANPATQKIAQPAAPDPSAALRQDLASAYDQIVARSSGEVKPVVVDADAALSIDIPDHRTIRGAVKYFSGDLHEKIQASLDRSAQFKPMIDKVLDEYKLPRALAYLPVIESAYSPTLTSRSGAHGVWQFMPSTAAEYGLRLDWWVDDRANPEKSTRAAARYLRDLYNHFQDWPLALAAYNAGPGRVSRALTTNNVTTFWELCDKAALPKETRGYVPTFFATILIASDPPSYGFQLHEAPLAAVQRVAVEGPLSLDYLADVAEVDASELRQLNPELRRGLIPPGLNQIVVPAACASTILSKASTLRYEDTKIAVASFTFRPGDTLDGIARAIGIQADEILKMNGLASSRIAAGDSIYLPLKQTDLSNRLQARQAPTDGYYTVTAGDTLYSIARRFGLSVEELTDLNRLEDTAIHPGDRLRISLGTILTTGSM
ncbi:MAG: LysM peptidoglycan-binding domain-containing protein [Acidobacteriota bacterium]